MQTKLYNFLYIYIYGKVGCNEIGLVNTLQFFANLTLREQPLILEKKAQFLSPKYFLYYRSHIILCNSPHHESNI